MAHHWRVASWGSASRPPRWRGASSTSTTRCPSSTRSATLGRRRGRMTDRREHKKALRALRRVMYCGEWLHSHALDFLMLALPDLLGYHSITAMAAEYSHEVRRGIMLQGLGNALIELHGARSVHPDGVKLSSFQRIPRPQERAAKQ